MSKTHHVNVKVENFNAFLEAVQAASGELDHQLRLGAHPRNVGNVLLGFVQHVADGLNDGHEKRPERDGAQAGGARALKSRPSGAPHFRAVEPPLGGGARSGAHHNALHHLRE